MFIYMCVCMYEYIMCAHTHVYLLTGGMYRAGGQLEELMLFDHVGSRD